MKRLILMLIVFGTFQASLAYETGTSSQLLYYADNQMHLYTTETRETYTLPDIHAVLDDRWLISPNRQYLLQLSGEDWDNKTYRIYDLQAMRWTEHESFQGGLSVAWSADGQSLAYALNHGEPSYFGELWIYSLEERHHERLYHTSDGTMMNPWAIGEIQWTPQSNILLFYDYEWIMGGSINNFNWLNIETGERRYLAGAYYGGYRPEFSPNGEWFLLHIESNYICKSCEGLRDESEYGDMFLFHTADGQRYQVTNDDQIHEGFISWSEDSSSFILSAPEEDSSSGYLQYSIEDVLAHQSNLSEISPSEVEVETEVWVPQDPYFDRVAPNGAYWAELNCGDGGCNLFVTDMDAGTSDVLVHYGRVNYYMIFFNWMP